MSHAGGSSFDAGWKFMNDNGDFELKRPDLSSYLYFPLANEAGLMSCVTPTLHGQATAGHNTFLLEPVSVEDLHNSRASRNFWVFAEGKGAWSAVGQSASQIARRFEDGSSEVLREADEAVLEAGFLWHKVTRTNRAIGLQAEVVSFVPETSDLVELMRVTLTNMGESMLRLTPAAAIPIYGRSADDLRDHRHVTSLLHRIRVLSHGIEVKPTLSFDERGHRVNRVVYGVLGCEGEGAAPVGFFPITEDFIGEGGSLDWPEAIVRERQPSAKAGDSAEGYEAIGGLRFATVELKPGERKSYVIAMAISDEKIDIEQYVREYMSAQRFDRLWEDNKAYWERKLGTIGFGTGDRNFDHWMKWVALQPILRRLYGNSFLPYHDYGRGGRGWRDLWQDCLALLIMEPDEVRSLLYNNYAGVRIDGSNATIIGAKPGEFVADRNNIPRVWMDHGAWPLLTTFLYLHQSGDLAFLLQEQTYFKDRFISWCKDRDESWTPEAGDKLLTVDGALYRGTVLEHILLQNLIPFFNVGEHNNSRLEGADWNDGLDMASQRGESVAFTAFYAGNLLELSRLLLDMRDRLGVNEIELAEEMAVLLEPGRTSDGTAGCESVDSDKPVDDKSVDTVANYDSVEWKRTVRDAYFQSVARCVSGRKIRVDTVNLSADLARKAKWTMEHLRQNEWIRSSEGYEWFNGYYNNDGKRVEGDHPDGVRMTLTGQVFSIMAGVAEEEQIRQIVGAVDRYLKDPTIGYRLNTRFGDIQQNLGRAFGFAFGHKENGAMFSHMTVMYANALYKRGFVKEGFAVLDSVYRLSSDFARSRIYPGIPEYISERGRGMYPYLTGSASWLLLTMLTEVYGVKGYYGDLLFEPKLLMKQFDEAGEARVRTLFADRMLSIIYLNAGKLEYGDYRVISVIVDGRAVPYEKLNAGLVVRRDVWLALPGDTVHTVEVELG